MTDKKVILLVEDNKDDAELTVIALQKSNVLNDVVIVHDGAEALDYLFCRGAYSGRNPNAMPAITLLDLKLPKLGGLEVLKALRANPATRFLPVVVLTTSKQDQDVLEAYSFGCNSYVRKPVDFVTFSEAVRQLGVYWLLLNELPPGASKG